MIVGAEIQGTLLEYWNKGMESHLRDILYLTSASVGHGCFILSLQNQLFFHFHLYVTESGKIAIPKF